MVIGPYLPGLTTRRDAACAAAEGAGTAAEGAGTAAEVAGTAGSLWRATAGPERPVTRAMTETAAIAPRRGAAEPRADRKYDACTSFNELPHLEANRPHCRATAT